MITMPPRMRLLVLSGVLSFTIIGGSALWVTHDVPPTAEWRMVQGLLALLMLAAVVFTWFVYATIRDDLTRRIQVEEELRASEAKFAGILEIAADAVITMDAQQRIMHFNRGAERIFGYPASEVLGCPLDLLLPQRYRAAHAGHVRQFGQGEDGARQMADRRAIYGRRADGTEFPAEASISKLVLGSGERIYTVLMRDVSERQAFEELQHRLTAAVATVGETLDLTSTERSVVQLPVPWLADGAFLDLVGTSRHFTRLAARTEDPTFDAAAAHFIALPLNEDSAWPVIDAWSRRRRERVDEVTDEWIEGRATTTEEEARIQALGMRTVLFLPLVARDHALGVLTLYRRNARPFTMREVAVAEELTLRAAFALDNAQLYTSARQATQARDHALGVVSHDLRNPISAIGMSARALLASLPPEDTERRGMLANIVASQDLTQRMIRDLLDVANIETGHLAVESVTEDLAPMLERAISLFAGEAEARGVQLRLAPIAGPAPTVIADRERVVQALCNLLSNALRYTRRDGQVIVHVRRHDHEVEIAVADTGAGISPAAMPMIFERYWTVRGNAPKGGTGLGLAIARGIIEALGGRLWAESEEGKGSTFRFTLRIAA
ncbi:MAG: hypothetical protein RLZZ63_936 [Gemmatimonadota bacterium]|jgi:PAS domain S-box-containing protein